MWRSLEKGSLYTHSYHARSPSNNEATGCRPTKPSMTDRATLMVRITRPVSPSHPLAILWQPTRPTGQTFYESLLKTNRELRARSIVSVFFETRPELTHTRSLSLSPLLSVTPSMTCYSWRQAWVPLSCARFLSFSFFIIYQFRVAILLLLALGGLHILGNRRRARVCGARGFYLIKRRGAERRSVDGWEDGRKKYNCDGVWVILSLVYWS